MLAIIKKEVKSYFLSPIGYIFIGLLSALYSLFFYLDVYIYGSQNFEYMFWSASIVLTFMVSMLTMRMFSEERKNGTEILLYTSPRSTTQIVFAKFIATTLIVVISEVFTLIYLFILMKFGSPNLKIAFSTLFGFLLLSMAYIAFGMFISSITENQIIATLMTVVGLVVIWLLPALNRVFADFSLLNAFSNTFPYGIITYKSLTLLITFIILFIILTIVSITKRKGIR